MNACLTAPKKAFCLEHLPADADDDPEVWARFHDIEARQANLSNARLCQLHRNWFGKAGVFAGFFAEITRMGRQSPLLNDAAALRDRRRLMSAERALVFVLAKVNRRPLTGNPFKGRSRGYLCCVIFDQSSDFTLCERYAAYEALREEDSRYFAKLIQTIRIRGDRRVVFRGLIEHFSQSLPVERCVYSPGYREAHQAHLDREEILHGPLKLSEPLSVLLRRMTALELNEHIVNPVQVLRR
jgi:hypothetical protein